MNCEQIDRFLDAMMDGEISTKDMNALETHCQTCAACAEKLKLTIRRFARGAPARTASLQYEARKDI